MEQTQAERTCVGVPENNSPVQRFNVDPHRIVRERGLRGEPCGVMGPIGA
jgi:hypothetical protein